MMNKKALFFLFASILFSACESSTNNGGSNNILGGSPIALDALCSQLAEVQCAAMVRCCPSQGVPVDLASCKSKALSSCQTNITNEQNKGHSYSSLYAGGCYAGMQSILSQCTQSMNTSQQTAFINTCSLVWTGNLPPGSTCKTSSDCAPQGQTPGICASSSSSKVCAVMGMEGQACATSISPPVFCAEGLYCDTANATSGTCKKLPTLGQPCTGVCATGSFCDFASKLCKPPRSLGEKCSMTTECGSAAFCNEEKVCASKLANGTACKSSLDCLSNQCLSGLCSPSYTFSTNSCRTYQ